MLRSYMQLKDGTLVVYSGVEYLNGEETVRVRFERPSDDGFDIAECTLPKYTWDKVAGFSESDINRMESTVRRNAHLIIEFAREDTKNA